MWNTRYLARLQAAPRRGSGRISPTPLSRAPHHLRAVTERHHPPPVEVILQAYGWDRGWAPLTQMGGNMGSITDAFGVPEAVISGQCTGSEW